jgi:hypothetical protein
MLSFDPSTTPQRACGAMLVRRMSRNLHSLAHFHHRLASLPATASGRVRAVCRAVPGHVTRRSRSHTYVLKVFLTDRAAACVQYLQCRFCIRRYCSTISNLCCQAINEACQYGRAGVIPTRLRTLVIVTGLFMSISASWCSHAASALLDIPSAAACCPQALVRTITPPLGLPRCPSRAIRSPRLKSRLGHALFFDRRLSHNNAMSCAMCHVPEQGFAVRTSWQAV